MRLTLLTLHNPGWFPHFIFILFLIQTRLHYILLYTFQIERWLFFFLTEIGNTDGLHTLNSFNIDTTADRLNNSTFSLFKKEKRIEERWGSSSGYVEEEEEEFSMGDERADRRGTSVSRVLVWLCWPGRRSLIQYTKRLFFFFLGCCDILLSLRGVLGKGGLPPTRAPCVPPI